MLQIQIPEKYLLELKTYCNKTKPSVSYFSKLIQSYNKTTHNILRMKLDYYCPKYQKGKSVELSPHKYQVSLDYPMKAYPVSFNENAKMIYPKL